MGTIMVLDKKKNEWIDVEVSDCDEDWICEKNWRFDKYGYIVRGTRIDYVYKTLRLHREIMKKAGRLTEDHINWQVDHINHDKLDNRRENLRVCMPKENYRNRRKAKGTNSKYKGVYKQKDGRFKTYVTVDGKAIYIGTFNDERMAAYYYNLAAQQLHGEFAELNKL